MKFFHTVTGRMTMIVCVVLFPIVIFNIAVTGFMVDSLREQILSANENEMALFCSQVDQNLEDIVNDLNRIVEKQWDAMYQARQNGDFSIVQYQCWQLLREVRSSRDNIRYAYVKSETAEDEQNTGISLTYQQHDHSYLESRNVYNFLKVTNLKEYENRRFIWVQIGNEDYMICNINVGQVSLGVFLDVKGMLGSLQSANENEGIMDGFVDSSYNWIGSDLPEGMEAEAGKMQTEERAWNRHSVICLPFQNMDYSICRVISEQTMNASMPLLQRGLQLASFLSILIIPLLWLLMRSNVLAPLSRLNHAMEEIEGNNLDYRLEYSEQTLEFGHMQTVFNHMAEQIQHLKIESYEKDIEKLQIEATNLRLQVSPHMLTNSLNMIYNLALSKNFALIQEFSLCLSNYFRYSLHRFEGFVRLRDEMEFVESYIGIQKIRFPEAFVYVYDIEEELFEEKVPPLLIQNFVENSIKYALKLGSEIEILVVVKKAEDKLTISVVDTGSGMEEEVLEKLKEGAVFEDGKGKHIGIWNCRRRLKMYYGEAAVLNISSSPGEGTQVWIEIPVEAENESVNCR